MKFMKNTVLGLFMLALIPLSGCADSSAKRQLVGSWTHVKLEHSADGKIFRTMPTTSKTTMVFKADGTWTLTSPADHSNGTYRWLDKKSIESVIIASTMGGQVGTSNVKQVDVDAQTLRLSTAYNNEAMKQFAGPDGKHPADMTVISTFARDPAPK
jgi:outer membrane biogenesis lipoprotein LolB